MKIRTQADIESSSSARDGRIRHASVADLLFDSVREHSGRVAIRYLAGTGPTTRCDVTYDELRRRVIQTANLLPPTVSGPTTPSPC